MTRYGIGAISLGSIGLRMLRSMSLHRRFHVVSAWDPSDAAVGRAHAAFPGVEIADSADRVITDARVDAVYIASPPAHHRAYADRAIVARRPILCEKPLGIDLAASRALVDHVERAGVPNAVNFIFAAAQGADHIVAARARGELGEIQAIDVRLHLPAWAARRLAEAPWLGEREQGGFVREVLSHFFYLVERLLGPARIEAGEVRYPAEPGRAERQATALLVAGGVPVTINGTLEGPGPEVNECLVRGTRGAVRLRDLWHYDLADGTEWVAAVPASVAAEEDARQRQLDAFAAMLDGGRPHPADFRAALSVQTLIEALLARGRRGPPA
ncbi:MAG: Gfo/Idh/MocA family oxidoreductase [Alphaproteobacteria bacterium]|nr:Gfo/Idh/MocA family oxidoreductase [Alphaproteobacteria bacterium]